ncbi:MAG: hypothetical protein ACOVLE_17910 [Pirellula staleyi]
MSLKESIDFSIGILPDQPFRPLERENGAVQPVLEQQLLKVL